MEIVVLLVVVIAALGWFLWRDRRFEESGSHPLDGATKSSEPWPFPTGRPAEGTQTTTTSILDINKDGKVDINDVVAAKEIVVEKTKKTASKTKAAVKKTTAKAKQAVKQTAGKKTKK